MGIIEEKNLLRKEFKKKRSQIDEDEVREKSQQIANNFITHLLPKIYPANCGKIFSLYLDSNNEVSTAGISEFFTANKIAFSYPKIVAMETPLQFILRDEEQRLISSGIFPQILEPENGTEILPDIVILPLLAFDSDLSRLGMGGGFFDRTISSLEQEKAEIITVGLGYEFQRSRALLPCENTDRALDFIVTEEVVTSRSHAVPILTRKKSL
jgi:5-formyltetrahydrofolate cyclo-ligase